MAGHTAIPAERLMEITTGNPFFLTKMIGQPDLPLPGGPARLNRPLTVEGWQVWDLTQRLGGQVRVTSGAVIGWDMAAALALGAALGISPPAMAELLPEIEAVMVRKLNDAVRSGGLEGHDP